MSNVLIEEKKQQVIALGRLGWSLRRIERAAHLRRSGSQKAWAKQNGLSAQYVSDVIAGRRQPGDTVLSALGLAKGFIRVDEGG